MENTTLDCWAIVEIMGQKKVAGKVLTQVFGSTSMLRVDVPETEKKPQFTQIFGMGSIYCLTPVDEITAKSTAETLNVSPPFEWEQHRAIAKTVESLFKEKMLLLNPSEEVLKFGKM